MDSSRYSASRAYSCISELIFCAGRRQRRKAVSITLRVLNVVVLIVPDWATEPGADSALRQGLPGLNRLAEIGHVCKLLPEQSSLTPEQQVLKIVRDELVALFGTAEGGLRKDAPTPRVVLLLGLQGSGKTTTSGKLARWLKRQGKHPIPRPRKHTTRMVFCR